MPSSGGVSGGQFSTNKQLNADFREAKCGDTFSLISLEIQDKFKASVISFPLNPHLNAHAFRQFSQRNHGLWSGTFCGFPSVFTLPTVNSPLFLPQNHMYHFPAFSQISR